LKNIKHKRESVRVNKRHPVHSSNEISIIVTGPRHYADRKRIFEMCSRVVNEAIEERKHDYGHDGCHVKIITGMHSPSCAIARDFAIQNGMDCIQVNFNEPYSKSGIIRKMNMLKAAKSATHVLAFQSSELPCKQAKRMEKYATINGAVVYTVPVDS